MELKKYQIEVLSDLEKFLGFFEQSGDTGIAFKEFWKDKNDVQNPTDQEYLEMYKNTIPGASHVCIKVPTAGGKTFIACNALKKIFAYDKNKTSKVVVWLVPWSNILDQTVANLRNPAHPYRMKLNSLFNNRVEVYEKKDLLTGNNFSPAVVQEQLSIVVMNFNSIRVTEKGDRKVYTENSQLASFVNSADNKRYVLAEADETSVVNVLRKMKPVLIVDESHNAESPLSIEMLNSLNPSFILDLTATPKNNSNIISYVPAIELKKEHMVKLPVIVYNHHDKSEVVSSALHLRQKLEILADKEHANGGRYIRPIVLFQAQPKTKMDSTTFEKLKEQLLRLDIPEEQIKIKTATIDELKGINLSDKECPVRFIITINALKEGWDCPFAYVLASLADKSSSIDVEQILGRVLRQPYAVKHDSVMLNMSYVLTASGKFKETLASIVKGLQINGFSDKDYRQKDSMTDEERQQMLEKSLAKMAFSEDEETEDDTDDIKTEKIIVPGNTAQIESIGEIEKMAVDQHAEMEKAIGSENKGGRTVTSNGTKEYKIISDFKSIADKIALPQFFLETEANVYESNPMSFLTYELLTTKFDLRNLDSEIDFSKADVQLVKVDVNKLNDDYDVRTDRIDDQLLTTYIIEQIRAKPHENQVKDVAHKLLKYIGNFDEIKEPYLRIFTERALSSLASEQLYDAWTRPMAYGKQIKDKIRRHLDVYAEKRFNEFIFTKKISVKPEWKFPDKVALGSTGAPINKSLYEREAYMNDFETSFISEIAGLKNVEFWHRNVAKKEGFQMNGAIINHYPDFIVYTKNDNIIIIETKGGDRDNSDSEAKCKLGRQWQSFAGKKFFYFMVFEKNKIEDALSVQEGKEFVSKL